MHSSYATIQKICFKIKVEILFCPFSETYLVSLLTFQRNLREKKGITSKELVLKNWKQKHFEIIWVFCQNLKGLGHKEGQIIDK